LIRLGLRLMLGGGIQAFVRLAVIAIAVALGVGMLLASLAGISAVNAQNARYAWLNTGSVAALRAAPGSAAGHSMATAPLWWRLSADYFGGQSIGRVDVAATGPGSPVPPGIPRLPGPGQFYASPALSTLLRETPADELGDRFPGRQVGVIGSAALPAPNSLMIVIGHTASQARALGAVEVTRIPTTPPSSCSTCVVGTGAAAIDLVLSIVVLALLFPVLIFIGAATRLSAARREERFAAMRLVGATPRQVSVISAVESSAAAILGTAAGFGVFFLIRDPLAGMAFTGAPFFPGDLSLSLADILAIAVGVPAAAAVSARLALRRVNISPLGVTRRVTPRSPSAWRLIPPLAGVAELAYFVVVGRPASVGGQVMAYVPGPLLIMAGLVTAGPWLTAAGARLIARRTSRPAALIAARRLADNPAAGFRAVSGLTLALFVTAAAVGLITTLNVDFATPTPGANASTTLVEQLVVQPGAPASADPGAVVARLSSIAGVRGVTAVHVDLPGVALSPANGRRLPWPPAARGAVSLVSCAQLARTPALGRCQAGAVVAAILPPDAGGSGSGTVWPSAAISLQRLARLRVEGIAVSTIASTAALERARTALELAFPDEFARARAGPMTIEEMDFNADLAGWQQLADVAILTSLPIAGCSLAVSVAAGLSDRKRPFSLLRLTGAPLGMLRRVIALESAVPLIAVAGLSSGAGFLAAELFLRSQLHDTLLPPSAEYYVTVAAGLVASLGIMAATFPLLNRITGPETARNE
jgi:hypothetical protein